MSAHPTPTRFWEKYLAYLIASNKFPDKGQCTDEIPLRRALRMLNFSYARVHAPNYISIDTITNLPSPLRNAGLVVIRLGLGKFTLCRPREGIESYAINPPSEVNEIIELRVPKWTYNIAISAGEYPFSQLVVFHAVREIFNMTSPYMFSSVRLGSASFKIEPQPGYEFHYKGQVEADIIAGENFIISVEAKTKLGLLKHKVAFSCQSIADLIDKEVQPAVVYLNIKSREGLLLILDPKARPNKPYPINEMRVRRAFKVALSPF